MADKAKKTEQAIKDEFKEEVPAPEVKEQVINPDVEALQKQIEELKSAFFNVVNQQQGAQATSSGLVGTVEKYKLDPNYYPDPTERLSSEPRLQRFAFKENYELDFEISSTQYKTIDGLNMKEPKFTIYLNKVVFDEDSGEATDGRYVICNATFHEDPDAAIAVARENGLAVDDKNEKEFLDEMRYIRMRDWLMDVFYPPKPSPKSQRKEMVVGGRVVDYFEINSQDSESIPFNQLKNKVK